MPSNLPMTLLGGAFLALAAATLVARIVGDELPLAGYVVAVVLGSLGGIYLAFRAAGDGRNHRSTPKSNHS